MKHSKRQKFHKIKNFTLHSCLWGIILGIVLQSCTRPREPYPLYVAYKKGAPLYAAADLSSKKIATLTYGEGVVVFYEENSTETIKGKIGRWLHVFTEGKTGYTLSLYFTANKPIDARPIPTAPDSTKKETVTQDSLPVLHEE